SKSLIFEGVKNHPVSYWMLFAASVGTVASFTKLSLLFRRSPMVDEQTKANHNTLTKGPFQSGYLGMGLLAAFCIAGGALGTYGVQFFSAILFGKDAINPHCTGTYLTVFLWTRGQEYLKTIVTLSLGYGVYRLLVSKKGRDVQAWANRLRISFDNQLVLLLFGLLLLVGFLSKP
ncbi:MAG: hypothetical protein N2442_00480, partial [Spirochaetes bacterium]|nr:hypothetical protein [Spirochaetota bacterium]